MKHIQTFESFNINLNEGYEVHYSDGVRQMKRVSTEDQAVKMAKDLIKNKKGLQFVDVFKAGPNFHSTADIDAVVAWWGDGSYMDNMSKKDDKLASKKIDESEEVNEDFGAIAIGVMLAFAGLNLLKGIATRVLGRWGENQEQDPEKLKKIVAEIAVNTANQTGANTALLQNADIKKELDEKIDSGEIKNLGQLRKFFEDYQKKQIK